MSETPLDLAEIRRCYIPDMLEARNREGNQCDCNWPDSVSIDGDWLHVAGEHFAAAVDEVERLRAENAALDASLNSMDHFAMVAEKVERRNNELVAINEVLHAENVRLAQELAS